MNNEPHPITAIYKRHTTCTLFVELDGKEHTFPMCAVKLPPEFIVIPGDTINFTLQKWVLTALKLERFIK